MEKIIQDFCYKHDYEKGINSLLDYLKKYNFNGVITPYKSNKGIFFLKVVNLCNGKTLADYGITESPLTKELQKTKLVLDKKSGKLTNVKTFKSNPT